MTLKLRSVAVCALLLIAASSHAELVVTKSKNKIVYTDLEFGRVDGEPILMDLHVPLNTKGKPPVVLYFHGGSWRTGSHHGGHTAWLVGQGYAFASVGYRLTGVAGFPAQIHDCKSAIRWLRAHAKEYGYSAEKIGVAGISAGGHLVGLLGTSGDVKELEGDVGGNLD